MFPSGPKSFKFASVCLFTEVITEGERNQENLKKCKSRSYQHLDFDHCGDVTDQPCECEKCAGIRRHDVGLRSGNWIMILTAATAQESHLLCGWAWSLSSLTPLALCRSLTSKQPRNTQWQCVRRQKMQLTACPRPGEVTCHPTSHVTAHTRGSGLQHNSGKLSRGNRRCVLCVMCVLKIVVVQQRSLSSKFN